MSEISQIISVSFEFSRLMVKVGGDCGALGRKSIEEYSEETKKLCSQMNGHGWTTLVISGAGGITKMASPFLPQGANAAASTALNPRATANAALADSLSGALKKIGGNLGPICNATSDFLTHGLTNVADALSKGKTAEIEARRDIVRLPMNELPQKGQGCFQQAKDTNNYVTTILQLDGK